MNNDSAKQPVSRNDYPHVKFWTRKEWLDHEIDITTTNKPRGKVRASQGINVSMRYVEDELGNIVDGFVASEMRKFARSIWVHIAGSSGAPSKWGDAGVKVAQYYRQEMCARFPILRLCELDWKVDQIATDNYPSWYTTWSRKMEEKRANIKEEPDVQVLPTPGSTLPPKRLHDTSSNSAPKRMKIHNEESIRDEVDLSAEETTKGNASGDLGFKVKNCLPIGIQIYICMITTI